MRYVDGFVLPVPTKNLKEYRRIAQKAGKIWRSHGAVEYIECVGDDLKTKMGVPFPRMARARGKETVVLSWIVYKSRGHRNRVNAKVMKDPRIKEMMDPKSMPFDVKRMTYGGFKILVDLGPDRAATSPPVSAGSSTGAGRRSRPATPDPDPAGR